MNNLAAPVGPAQVSAMEVVLRTISREGLFEFIGWMTVPLLVGLTIHAIWRHIAHRRNPEYVYQLAYVQFRFFLLFPVVQGYIYAFFTLSRRTYFNPLDLYSRNMAMADVCLLIESLVALLCVLAVALRMRRLPEISIMSVISTVAAVASLQVTRITVVLSMSQ